MTSSRDAGRYSAIQRGYDTARTISAGTISGYDTARRLSYHAVMPSPVQRTGKMAPDMYLSRVRINCVVTTLPVSVVAHFGWNPGTEEWHPESEK